MARVWWAVVLLGTSAFGQVYSPKLLREGQPDSTDLRQFARAICDKAGAQTEREKAEAIWRFFLTDGRFVEPGFWYHIAGWTYEEPTGEVLDPMKLLNSYGFGLCYHIAPLLTAVYDAAGFEDARVWFLTGHTVAEVFYEGQYHYFDSDMMGYNPIGSGPFKGERVAGVHELETDSNIMTSKLRSPTEVKPGVVDQPWYPADVHAAAIGDLAALFATTKDNYLFPSTRYASGHSMDFVLRPGEKLIRFFKPEEPGLFYLPYKFDGRQWTEFPQEIAEYQIETKNGPASQKDKRSWATGRIEYSPPSLGNNAVTVIGMPSPYVIIEANFKMNADLQSARCSLLVETSVDGGQSWDTAAELKGPHTGIWNVEPGVVVKSKHGRKTAVSGSYGYLVRITKGENPDGTRFTDFAAVTRIQLNPRSLPFVSAGANHFVFSDAAPEAREAISTPLSRAPVKDMEIVTEQGQTFLRPLKGKTGEVLYTLEGGNRDLTGFDVGARFLDLQNGLAPDKLTAETRPTHAPTESGEASVEWGTSVDGPFQKIWSFPEARRWRDGEPIQRLLRWPEVLKKVRDLPEGTERVFIRMRSSGPAIDSIRLASYRRGSATSGRVKVTQVWFEGDSRKEHVETVDANSSEHPFTIDAGVAPQNASVTFEELP